MISLKHVERQQRVIFLNTPTVKPGTPELLEGEEINYGHPVGDIYSYGEKLDGTVVCPERDTALVRVVGEAK